LQLRLIRFLLHYSQIENNEPSSAFAYFISCQMPFMAIHL